MNEEIVLGKKLYWGLAEAIDDSETVVNNEYRLWLTGPQKNIAFIFVRFFYSITSNFFSINRIYGSDNIPIGTLKQFNYWFLVLLLFVKSNYREKIGGSHANISYISFDICHPARGSAGNLRPGYQINGNN